AIGQRHVVAEHHESRPGYHAAQRQQQDGGINIDFGWPEGHARPVLWKYRSAQMPASIPMMTAAARPSRKGSNWPTQAVTPAASMETSIGLELASGTVMASRASTAAKSSDQPVGTNAPR